MNVRQKFKYLANGCKGSVELHFQDGEFVSGEFRGILEGKNYPFLYEGPAACILDVGANAGAFSVFAGICYPEARIIACEPSAAVFECLTRNAAMNPHIEAHHLGLYRKDMRARLYRGKLDSMHASISKNVQSSSRWEEVRLRNARNFLREIGVRSVDILKLDTQGCEVPILKSLATYCRRMKVIYVEYHSERDRLEIDVRLSPTHILCHGRISFAHRGMLAYMRKGLSRTADRYRIDVDGR